LGSDGPKRSPQIARIAKIPKIALFWQTGDLLDTPNMGEFLTIGRDRHQRIGTKEEALETQ
jgi:hypothetical protein